MPSFLDLPVNQFLKSRIELIEVGSSSVNFILDGDRSIILYYYGALEDKYDWLYNIPLCGDFSVQSLIGHTIENIVVLADDVMILKLSNGKSVKIVHDELSADLINLKIGGLDYIA